MEENIKKLFCNYLELDDLSEDESLIYDKVNEVLTKLGIDNRNIAFEIIKGLKSDYGGISFHIQKLKTNKSLLGKIIKDKLKDLSKKELAIKFDIGPAYLKKIIANIDNDEIK